MIETKTSFSSANILGVEVGSNCPQGGDGGHGGVTFLRLIDEAATSWGVTNTENSLSIEFYGDSECETFIKALRFAADELQRIHEINTKEYKEYLLEEQLLCVGRRIDEDHIL